MTGSRCPLFILVACLVSLAGPGEAKSDTLLKDRQMVDLNLTVGPGSMVKGSRGMGKFRQGLNAEKGTFGPAKVLRHTQTELRFKGRRDDCTLKADRTVICKSGSKGTWR